MEESKVYKVIAYTDGSCILGSGTGGGCHAYLYDKDCFVKNTDKPNHYSITDHGYREKHELKEEHKELKPAMYFNAVFPHDPNGTNNRSELLAVIDTIVTLTKQLEISDIDIYTDSMYTLRVHRAVSHDLDDRKWNNEERPNLDLWILLADTLADRKNVNINLHKVTAHGTAIGNNLADRLAYAARELSSKGDLEPRELFYVGKYWTNKPTPHPMLNFKQVYFNVGIMPDTDENMYAIMDYPKEVELGKKSSEPLFGLSIFKEPVAELEQVMSTYVSHCKGNKYLTAVDLRVLYTQLAGSMTELLGKAAYNFVRSRLLLLGEKIVATPITPPGLAQNALAKTLSYYQLYKHYMDKGVSDDGITSVIDITDQLYDVNAKGKFIFKYPQNIVGPDIIININGIAVNMCLVYGKDTLTRNQLKKLEADNPKVLILLKKHSDTMYEYFNIIDIESAVGVYGNYYINKLYV